MYFLFWWFYFEQKSCFDSSFFFARNNLQNGYHIPMTKFHHKFSYFFCTCRLFCLCTHFLYFFIFLEVERRSILFHPCVCEYLLEKTKYLRMTTLYLLMLSVWTWSIIIFLFCDLKTSKKYTFVHYLSTQSNTHTQTDFRDVFFMESSIHMYKRFFLCRKLHKYNVYNYNILIIIHFTW